MCICFIGLIGWLTVFKPDEQVRDDSHTPKLDELRAETIKALDQGRFHTALELIGEARSHAEWDNLPENQRRQIAHAEREAGILADLLEISLQELLQLASETPPREWALLFRRRYQGKAVLFDAKVSRNSSGKLVMNVRLWLHAREVSIEINDLSLFKHLPIDPTRRIIFGTRLAGIRRQAGGIRVIYFAPESGVLMTQKLAVEFVCPSLASDAELGSLLQRQKNWLASRP